jgi:hypothetical protein
MRIATISFFILLILNGCKSNRQTNESSSNNEAVAGEAVQNQTPPPPPKPLNSEFWSRIDEADLPDLERAINPTNQDLWQCQYDDLLYSISNENIELMLPTDQGIQVFNLVNSGTMSPELAAKFPNIKSYKGKSLDGSISARVDTNEKGLYAEFKTGSDIILLAPYLKGSRTIYTVYNKEDLPKIPRDESFEK